MATIEEQATSALPLRAVLVGVPQFLLDWRKQTGADRRDEVWEGVWHMAPSPNRHHTDFAFCLRCWLRDHWEKASGGRVHQEVNLSSRVDNWRSDYRVPDLVLVTPDRFHIDRNEFFAGPPLVVVEIRSPGDETDDKLPFYAALGVPEVWVFERDSKQPELLLLAEGKYSPRPADADLWYRSPATGVEFRVEQAGRVTVRLAGDEATKEAIPER
jgi:Uma2 family endonuclease